MYAIDSSDTWQEGCANTRLIAEMIDVTGMFEKRDLMPRFDIPEGYTEVSWFREATLRGMHRRFPDGIPDDRVKQVEYEMDTIISMGFPGYFLVVADFIMWAKKQGIAVGPGRGSAAGSIVAYAMGITDLDPIPHGLIFERFLNPEHISMPDVDIDFETEDGVPVEIKDITPNVRTNAESRNRPSRTTATKSRKLSGVVTEVNNRGELPAVRWPAKQERQPPSARGAV